MSTTTTNGHMTEAEARKVLGSVGYEIAYRQTSIGRLVMHMTNADLNGETRRGDALHHIITRRQQEGIL